GEVDDPDQSAVDELGQLRHDLTCELVAGEAENHIFHRTDAHGLSPVWPRHPRSVRPQVSTNDEQGLSPPEDDSTGKRTETLPYGSVQRAGHGPRGNGRYS